MKYFMLCLILLALCDVSQAADTDQLLAAKGHSFAPSMNGKAPIYQILSMLQQAVQQNDVDALASLVTADINNSRAEALPTSMRKRVLELFESPENAALLSASLAPGWKTTGFRDFRFEVDSIVITGEQAVAYLLRLWRPVVGVPVSDDRFSLAFVREEQRWHLQSSESVLELLDLYAQTATYLNDPEYRKQVREPLPSDKGTASITDVPYSDMMLNPVNWWQSPAVARVTRTVSEQQIATGLNLQGCVSGISSFIYIDAAAFAADLVATSDDCLRQVVVMDDYQEYLAAHGHQGTAATRDEYAAPRGMEFCGPSLLYVIEDYNNRIKELTVSSASNDHVDLFKIVSIPQFNHPEDLDVSQPDESGYRHVVVANTGAGNILAYYEDEPNYLTPPVVINGLDNGLPYLRNPTSVAFGRDPLTGAKTDKAFFIAFDHRRVVCISNVFILGSPGWMYDGFSDPRTYLSAIAVDNKGEVWVVDQGLGKVYKFTSGLVPIATHGSTGLLDREYMHPTSLSVPMAYTNGYPRLIPIPGVGEIVLGEEWGYETGIRRLVPGTEILGTTIRFCPKTASDTIAHVRGEYLVTGYSNITEEFIGPTAPIDTFSASMSPSGAHSFEFHVPCGAPNGTYQVRITAQSIYTNSNTDQVTLSVYVDNTIINQPPVISNMYFPSGDSCLFEYVLSEVAATAHDPDGTISAYHWRCDPVDAGYFYDSTSAIALFAAWPDKLSKEPGRPKFLRVTVTDNYGQNSWMRSMAFDHLIVDHADECLHSPPPCTHCGDADGNGAVNVSDAVFLDQLHLCVAHTLPGRLRSPVLCSWHGRY